MDAAPLPDYDERRRMATRLNHAWPALLVVTLALAPALHQLGLSGLLLVVVTALCGLSLTLAVVAQAGRARRPAAQPVPAEPPLVMP